MTRSEVNRRYRLKHLKMLRKKGREYQRKWRKDNSVLAKEKDRRNRLKYKIKRNEYSKKFYFEHKNDTHYKKLRNKRTLKYYYSNKVKALARNTVNKAIKRGLISKNDLCFICGSDKFIQAHHEDYNKPLDVKWVCRSCHYKLNQALADIRKKLEE